MAVHVQNITFHIVNNFYSCLLLVDFYFLYFLLVDIYIFHYEYIMNVLRQSPMHVHDVAGNLPLTICITKAPSSLLSTFMKKLTGL